MAGFDLLDRSLNFKGRYFLEASAGTGKTFAIETIVCRLILESDEFKVSNILLVTFTNAATDELKVRVAKRLDETLLLLEKGENLPDFLQAIVERGEEGVKVAKRRIVRARASFDKAKIFTLHGFALYALRHHAPLSHLLLNEISPSALIDQITKDLFRSRALFSERELTLLLDHFSNEMPLLLREIRQIVEKRVPIQMGKSEEEILEQFKKECERLKEKYKPELSKLFSDLLAHARQYKGICDRKKEIKEEVKERILNFVDLFSSPHSLPLESPFDEMNEENRLKKESTESLYYPDLVEEIKSSFQPLLKEALEPLFLLSKAAEGVRKLMEEKIEKEELFFYQDLILKMKKAIEEPSFVHSLRQEFRALFIDEFQDVDSDLWKIFSALFISNDFLGPIYFIGDPKQSIYRFRGADLYSYEHAKKSFSASVESLAVNFRSQPKLLSSLNKLFSCSDLFLLPKTQESLGAPPLAAGIKKEPRFIDSREPVHFFSAKREEELFHFIVSEINDLHERGLSFSECAILVRDRAQKERFTHFAKTFSLPVCSNRGRLLSESPALFFLVDLIKATLSPKEKKHVAKLATLPHYTADADLFSYSEILKKEGLLPWFCTLLQERRVRGDEEFFSDLIQLVEMMAEARLSSNRWVAFLERLRGESDESEKIRARSIPSESVEILTIHASKGLEFEVVFPLGLIVELKARRELLFDPTRDTITFSDELLRSHHKEEEAEGMRLLYVAMTRAKERLYLPLLEKRENSLISLFLKKRLKNESLESFCQVNQGFSLSLCDKKATKLEIEIKRSEDPSSTSLVLPVFTAHFQHSFSSLLKTRPYLGEREKLFDLKIPLQTREPLRLPSGKTFGSFLHELMEALPWEEGVKAISAQEITTLLSSHFALSPYADFMLPICDLIFKTLHTPMVSPSSFTLSDIDPKKMFREVEFLYPEREDLIKGFIDLCFEHEGKVYFADWKSNDLGEEAENYTRKNLHNVMVDHDYLLQSTLYRQALERYFALFGSTHSFGGGIFLFLRGMNENGNGIYVCT